MKNLPLTPDQKLANKLARQEAKKVAKELARIEAEKNQKEVAIISISIEWKKSRMWGHNPHLDADITFKDGTCTNFRATCSGCGYDKESTVIADVFNAFLKYKLYRPLLPVTTGTIRDNGIPYGITIDPDWKYYDGGIGMNCYYTISEAIGGKLIRNASGKSYDAYTYTDNEISSN